MAEFYKDSEFPVETKRHIKITISETISHLITRILPSFYGVMQQQLAKE